jgi:hypothetical protein
LRSRGAHQAEVEVAASGQPIEEIFLIEAGHLDHPVHGDA